MAIREARCLSKLLLEELMGSFMTHEIMMKDHDEDEEKEKKKSLAPKSFTQDEDEEYEEIGESELEDYALLSKNFKRYLRLKKDDNSKPNVNSNKHPMRKKRKKKVKKATWDYSTLKEIRPIVLTTSSSL